MHILFAPDGFTGTLTAQQAAAAMADGWRAAAPDDLLTVQPLSDGGPGFLDVIAGARSGEMVMTTVSDPLGRTVPAGILLTDDDGVATAWIESAQAIGLHLLGDAERNPGRASTQGLGELIAAAADLDVRRIIIGLGGSGTNDAGAGLLAALGVGPREVLARGGEGLLAVREGDLEGLRAVRERVAGIELIAATDVDAPLLGLQGASAVYAEQKGASAEQAQALEACLGHFSDLVGRVLPPATDLVTGRARRLDREPGAGAAGGVGYALFVLGAHRVSGVDLVLEAVDFDRVAAAADVIVTGEGTVDWQSLQGKVVTGVCRAGARHAVPVVIIAGRVLLGRREAMAMGAAGTYAVAERLDQVDRALLDPVGTLTDRAARVARTWSPRR